MAEHPLYQPLDQSRKQIRLLTIDPSKEFDETVSCHLEIVDLDPTLEFAAISYVWGDPKNTTDITVNGKTFKATRNLEAAMRSFREYGTLRRESFRDVTLLWPDMFKTSKLLRMAPQHENTQFRLWADAICINQNDKDERGYQVSLMGSIYSAAHVISWIGVSWFAAIEWNPLNIAIRAMRDFSYVFVDRHGPYSFGAEIEGFVEKGLEIINEQPELCQADTTQMTKNLLWNSIATLPSAEYWTRIWIVQEMVLSKSPDLHLLTCGDEIINLAQFELFFRFVQALTTIEQQGLSIQRPENMNPSTWNIISTSSYHWSFPLNLSYMRRYALGPGHALPIAVNCQASDPRDMVYGLMSVLNFEVTPDYNKPVREVYFDWIQAAFAHTPSRSPLGFSWAGIGQFPDNKHSIPSWIVDLSQSSKSNLVVRIPQEADMEIDLGNDELCQVDSDLVLYISGAVCDNVSETSVLDSEDPHTNLLRMCRSIKSKENEPIKSRAITRLQALFYSITQSIDPCTGTVIGVPLQPMSMAAQMFRYGITSKKSAENESSGENDQEMFSSFVDNQFWNYKDQHEHDAWKQAYQEAMSSPDFDRNRILFNDILNQVTKQVFFQTSQGFVGFGPPGTLPGDQICVLHGLDLPSLLRKSGEGFSHVGACYAYGLSDKEPLGEINSGKLEITRFNIS